MTKSNLLERKKQTLELKKNRLKQLESHVKTMERKTRTRRLIECGGLVAKAGLDDLES
ncbi:MAG: conjugal transfer protein TraD, partial [Caedimonadaceae bacterium]